MGARATLRSRFAALTTERVNAELNFNEEAGVVMKKQESSFPDRMADAAKAKRALLERARENRPAQTPQSAERQAARLAAEVARKARKAERNAISKAEKALKAEKKAAEDAARALAKKVELEAREAEALEQAALEVARQAKLKAARDLKYAARKARR